MRSPTHALWLAALLRPRSAIVLVAALALTSVACHGSVGSKTSGGGSSPSGGGGDSTAVGGAGAGAGGTANAVGGAGTTGSSGSAGASGVGASGTTGASGTGASGAAGQPGRAGSSGSAGASGGAGIAGGSGGAGTSGKGGTSGAGGVVAANPCATALFCDDFESYPAGQAPAGNWTVSTSGSAVAIDATQFHSGSKSVKFTTQAGASTTAFIRLASTPSKTIFPTPGNMFFGRMMFRLESAPTASVHWTLIEGSGLIPGQSYHALTRYGGQLPVTQGSTFVGSQLMASYDTPDSYSGSGPKSDCWVHSNKVVVPVAVWSCVEWQFDGSSNTMRLWLNGTPIPSLTVAGVGQGCLNQPITYTWTAPAFDRLDLGWESYQQDDARTLYIDDVVVSTSKIGCP